MGYEGEGSGPCLLDPLKELTKKPVTKGFCLARKLQLVCDMDLSLHVALLFYKPSIIYKGQDCQIQIIVRSHTKTDIFMIMVIKTEARLNAYYSSIS